MRSTSLDRGEWFDRFTYTKMVPFDLGESVFQVVRFSAGAEIGDHYHAKTEEVFLVLWGEGVLSIDGEAHQMVAGDIFLIEPDDAHAISTEAGVTIAIFKPKEWPDDIHWGRA